MDIDLKDISKREVEEVRLFIVGDTEKKDEGRSLYVQRAVRKKLTCPTMEVDHGVIQGAVREEDGSGPDRFKKAAARLTRGIANISTSPEDWAVTCYRGGRRTALASLTTCVWPGEGDPEQRGVYPPREVAQKRRAEGWTYVNQP